MIIGGGVLIIDTTNTSTEYWKGIYDTLQAKHYNVFVVEDNNTYSANLITRLSDHITIRHNYVNEGILKYHMHIINNIGKLNSKFFTIDLGSIEDKLNQITEEYE